MISPAWRIRDAQPQDLEIIRSLFYSEGFGDVNDCSQIRVAAKLDNTILGACRCEKLSDGKFYIRPVAVFEIVRGSGVGIALVKDALKIHQQLYLVAEGPTKDFYRKCGFEECSWEEIAYEQSHECDMCPDKDTCGPLPMKSIPSKHTITLLGTSSGCGVPAFFCHCLSCEAARKDPKLQRGCSGALISGYQNILIDTPPDIRHQLIREDISELDHVLLTHAHFDHLGGLGELEYFIRLYNGASLPFYASEYATKETFKEFEYMDDCFNTKILKPFDVLEIDSLKIQALPLEHCPGTFGYLINSVSGKRTFYAPDCGEIKPDVYEALRGVDTLIMDATFWENDSPYKTHHSVRQTIKEGLDLGAKKIVLTHLAPHICHEDENIIEIIEDHIKQYDGRVILAYDGLKIEL